MTTLTLKQRKFVNEYCVDENAAQAAIRAGYAEGSACMAGSRLLKEPKIKRAVEDRMREVAIAAGATPEWVVSQWVQIASADPNDLVQIRRSCCRHCHGYGHKYQWTEGEYTLAVDKAVSEGKTPPDGMGGFGFNQQADPHPECPKCGGAGIERVYMSDSRKLTGAARLLYSGAEKTRSGIKISMRDRDAALNNIARYLGMMVEKKEVSGPSGGPVPMANFSAEDLTDDQLAMILKGPSNATNAA